MSRIVYIGNSDFATGPLKSLVSNGHSPVLVVSQNDKKRSRGKLSPSPVKSCALDLGLDVHTTDDINSDDSIEIIRSVDPEFLVVVSFGQFIKKDFLNEYKDRILNVHASILPKYRGASPIQASLYNGDEETGVSIMLIDEGMDTGDVLSICKLKINPNDTSISLAERLSELGGTCLVDVIENFDSLYANRIIQDESQGSHVGFISKEMGLIDFDEKANHILNKHRAFYAWPKLYFTYKGESVKVHNLEIGPRINGYNNGEIIKVNDQGVFVNCEDRCIVFTELQFPGKKKMEISDYLRGNEIELIRLNEA